MLGAPLSLEGPVCVDLMTELAVQAYRTVRTLFSTMGGEFPDAAFSVVPPGDSIRADGLPGELLQLPFSMAHEGETLKAARAASVPAAFDDLGDEVMGRDGGTKANLGLLADLETAGRSPREKREQFGTRITRLMVNRKPEVAFRA